MEDSNYPIGPIDDGVANKMNEAKILTELRSQRDIFHKDVVVFIDKLQAELKKRHKGCCDDCFVVTEPEKENRHLKAKITKAIADIETAELGEGYEYNLREIIEDLKGE